MKYGKVEEASRLLDVLIKIEDKLWPVVNRTHKTEAEKAILDDATKAYAELRSHMGKCKSTLWRKK